MELEPIKFSVAPSNLIALGAVQLLQNCCGGDTPLTQLFP